MKKFWWESIKKWPTGTRYVLLFVFSCLAVVSFSFFSLYARITSWFFWHEKIDIFNDLEKIAQYFWVIDPEISDQLLVLDDVIKDYLSWDNVLQTREKELNELRTYEKDHDEYLAKLGFWWYQRILKMLSDAWPMREEIFQLLWKYERFNYLVPLQNSNEKRPNGGFFGSFAFISLSWGHIVDMQIVDSYLPDLLSPKTRVSLPSWTQGFLSEKTAWFIAGNKFWFTDLDGKNLKTLYEKIFWNEYDRKKKDELFNPEKWNQLFEKNIKGVVFLDSELITYLMPSFREKSREWQFVNANIDLIRGEDTANKKELYIKDLEEYLKNNALALAQSTIDSTQEMLTKGFVNIYLSNVSDKLRWFLQAYDLTTVYTPNNWYFFNINNSFNKSDGFVKKEIEFMNEQGTVVLSTDNKKLDITSLGSGEYTIKITYTLDVPKTYQTAMHALEEKYWVEMTDRERFILALQPENPDDSLPFRWRETQEIIYLPMNTDVLGIGWDTFDAWVFESDFSKWVYYKSRIIENKTTNTATITLRVK